MTNHIEEFRSELKARGLDWSGQIQDDGKLHRFKAEGDKTDSAWYVLHPPNPISAGAFGCWKRQLNEKWCQKNGAKYEPKELAVMKRQWAQAEAQRAADEQARFERMSERAIGELSLLPKATDDHAYLTDKSVPACGDLRINDDFELVLGLQDINGKVWSYQTIDPLGDKRFMPGGRVKACYFQIGELDDGPIILCEGYATGATINQITRWPVICAMNCGNLKAVAQDFRKLYSNRTIVIAADNDRFTKDNPGLNKAKEASAAINGRVCVPSFPTNSVKGTDFNDLSIECGSGVVRSQFEALLGIGLGQRISIKELLDFIPTEDNDSVIGNRYLCRGGSCVVVGQTSAGKSSLGLQMCVMFALGLDFFGMKPKRPLKSLYVQAENDVGDTAEMFQGILQGLGLVDPTNEEGNIAMLRVLEKNLIIIRDQTHIGPSFPSYARKLVELHNPDLFWLDPLLSFYGDDINNQQAMSLFLRAELNPISEQTGIIWMMLHHTGKPSKDATKTQKSWSSRDFAYMGLGSSELSNWARAIITVVNQGEDEFKVVFAKRGWRSGITNDKGDPATELNLAHSGDVICWKRIPKPQAVTEMNDALSNFARSITTPMSATAIVKLAADQLQRGVRTIWNWWGGGEGELGSLFIKDGQLWTPRNTQQTPSYDND